MLNGFGGTKVHTKSSSSEEDLNVYQVNQNGNFHESQENCQRNN